MKAFPTSMAIKKELYHRIRRQISDRLGQRDQEIKRSERALSRLFSDKWVKVQKEHFRLALEQSSLVFWGDFHGVRQSQKTLLRWLETQDSKDSNLVLALECFPSNSQKWLDAYLAGELSESDFLEKIRWTRTWGFPWEHYRPLLEWARRFRRPVLAVNAPLNRTRLKDRESWTLRLLEQYRAENPGCRIWVLYGEYHLLPQHFQRRLKNAEEALFVLQNSDRLYLKKNSVSAHEEVFRGPRRYFCLQNVPPWVKWQTYLLFLDLKEDQEIDEGLEITDHVMGWARILAQELGLSLRENELNVYANDEPALWEKMKKEPFEVQDLYRRFLEEGLSFVSPQGGWAYLSKISVNEAAGLALQVLFFQQRPELRWPKATRGFWERTIWIFALTYLGSKIINPHRKTPQLPQLQKKVRSAARPFERQAARLAVAYSLRKSLGHSLDLFDQTHSDRVRFQAARWIAGLWGERLYNAYHQRRLRAENLRAFLAQDPNQENFEVILRHFLEVLHEAEG